MARPIPLGFRLAGAYSGVKLNSEALDIALVVVDQPCTAAGVFTQNQVVAAPVTLCRERTPSHLVQAVVINSGNANACTGNRGWDDAIQITQLASDACGVPPESVLVMSTGIIGEHLDMKKIAAGIKTSAAQLAVDQKALENVAQAMLTTDLVTKVASRALAFGTTTGHIVGLAKGSGMIAPNMATMLGVILTDLSIQPEDAQTMLSAAVAHSFNCLSVDGHTSTNDTVLLLASGAASDNELDDQELGEFQEALNEVCIELTKAIASDGEGATHLIEIRVSGCASDLHALEVARAIANSPLVKTAIAGADPNWGRIVSAAGFAGVPFNVRELILAINGIKLFEKGSPLAFDAGSVSAAIASKHEVEIDVELAKGLGKATFWTSDLTAEYVRINADYHT